MLAPLSWLKEYVEFSATPEALAEKLSMAGLEVEAVQAQGAALDQVFTAKILKMEPHPNADKLTLCEVECGEEVVPVVCGAKNMKAGDAVALARPGAKLPNGLKIKKSKIRGEVSQGMLCSESELGLASESSGILILPPETPGGQPLAEVLGGGDTVLEVNVTPNRGDCLSIVGLAREVAANYGLKLKIPEQKHEDISSSVTPSRDGSRTAPTAQNQVFTVEVTASQACPRYSAQIMRGIKIGPSPKKIVERLEACGIRPINNVVDATNYVMLETGQPLHAFDLAKLSGGIQVRLAKAGEKIRTLEEQECELQERDLVIADHQHPVALAGVMGGKDSGVTEETTDLLLESAYFDPKTVRKTARRLGIMTESSYRFERGVDPNGCGKALQRLVELIQESAGGEKAGAEFDIYPQPVQPLKISLRADRLRKILGISLTEEEVLPPLKALGISGEAPSEEKYHLTIPTFRSDLTREIDVIEEVARLYGYNKIPTHYPALNLSEMPAHTSGELDRLEAIRTLLRDWGFTETLHYSFTSPQLLKDLRIDFPKQSQLANPISEELSVMRPALFPQMVQTLQQNIFRGAKHLKLFELRPVYEAGLNSDRSLQESWHLCMALAGSRRPEHFLEKDEKSSAEIWQQLNMLDLKGYMKALFQFLGLNGTLKEKPSAHDYFHPGQQLAWELIRGKLEPLYLGSLGQLHPQVLAKWDLSQPIILAEIKLDNFLTESKNRIQFKEISPYPVVGRDLNLILDEAVAHGQVLEVFQDKGSPWLQAFHLIDVYRGAPLPEGKKALTYRLEYGSRERTLTDEEVNQAREKLLAQLEKTLGAVLR